MHILLRKTRLFAGNCRKPFSMEVKTMKSQEVTVYREIQRNTEMAIKAIDTISGKIHDDEMAMQISRQSLKYAELNTAASKQLMAAKAEPYHSNYFSDMMLKMGIHFNTMFNTSTGHIAELMIKGTNMGVLEMEKILNHNKDAGEQPVSLAKNLIDFEEKSVKRLKDYL